MFFILLVVMICLMWVMVGEIVVMDEGVVLNEVMFNVCECVVVVLGYLNW